ALPRAAVSVQAGAASFLRCASAAQLAGQGTGVVYGEVRDSAGRAIAEAHVRLLGGGAGIADDRGHYRVANVAAGRLTVEVRRLGYRTALSEPTDLIAGDSVRIDFTLAPNRELQIFDTAAMFLTP